MGENKVEKSKDEAVRIEAAEVEAQVADISIAALPGEVSKQTNLTTRMITDLKDDLEINISLL